MTCEMCGKRMRAMAKRYYKTESGDVETYRLFICNNCSHRTFTVEYEIEQTDAFVAAWRASSMTKPKEGKE